MTFHEILYFSIFYLSVKRSRSTQGHHLTILVVFGYWMQNTISKGHQLLFEGFYMYRHGGHLGQVTEFICINLYKFLFLFSHKLSYEIHFQMTQQFLRKTSFNLEICVTFCHGKRTTLIFDAHLTSKLIHLKASTNFKT